MQLRKVFLLVFLVNLGCTDAIPDFGRLVPLEAIKFYGKIKYSLTFNTLGPPLKVKGECDKTTTNILVSKDGGQTWKGASDLFGANLKDDCTNSKTFSVTVITDNSGPLQFTSGQSDVFKISFKAEDGKFKSNTSELVIRYEPYNAAAKSGTLLLPSGGKLLGSQYNLHYRFGPNLTKNSIGSSYKIESSQ